MNIAVEFVRSAARAADFPRDGLPEIALVGRSNVGKSSLINALVRRPVARTSGHPGKTRLANIYRVGRGSRGAMYLVDLPGYGYASGGTDAARVFDEVTRAYFDPARVEEDRSASTDARDEGRGGRRPDREVTALLLVDARHPGLEADRKAWAWLAAVVRKRVVVATKIDKLARGERIRAQRELESVFDDPVLPVSADTGEGLDELWKLIDQIAHNPDPKARSRSRHRQLPPPPSRLPRK